MPVTRSQLDKHFSELLQTKIYQDYGPNGLQIEGAATISRIAFAVSATAASIQTACDQQADALIVHHGLFWSFHGVRTITGTFARRVKPLIKHNINLFAYHLPLDGHAELGNAATIAQSLELVEQAEFGLYKGAATGRKGHFKEALPACDLQQRLMVLLDHSVILSSPDPHAKIETIGIITGGANSQWREAEAQGLDAYLTGEISEHDWHEAQEAGIHMFAGGHHATEQFGIQRLMDHTRETFDVDCFYIDSVNPA